MSGGLGLATLLGIDTDMCVLNLLVVLSPNFNFSLKIPNPDKHPLYSANIETVSEPSG